MYYEKEIILTKIWQVSKYYNSVLYSCENLRNEEEGHASILLLLNILEITATNAISIIENSEEIKKARLEEIFKKCFDAKILTQREYEYLNSKSNSIRRLRNVFSHCSLDEYSIIMDLNGEEILWFLSESESSLILYDRISLILFNIILKFALVEVCEEINTNDLIEQLKFIIP